MAYPPVTQFPSTPSRSSSPSTFSVDMDAFLAAMANRVSQMNAAGLWMDSTASQVAAAAALAIAAIGAGAWVTGTTYAVGDVRYSPINFLAYRRKTNGAGATDPSLDTTNWALAAGQGDVTQAGVQTLTNKIIDAANNTILGVATPGLAIAFAAAL